MNVCFFQIVCTFFWFRDLVKISNIGANGPALASECDRVVYMRIERAEGVNATVM